MGRIGAVVRADRLGRLAQLPVLRSVAQRLSLPVGVVAGGVVALVLAVVATSVVLVTRPAGSDGAAASDALGDAAGAASGIARPAGGEAAHEGGGAPGGSPGGGHGSAPGTSGDTSGGTGTGESAGGSSTGGTDGAASEGSSSEGGTSSTGAPADGDPTAGAGGTGSTCTGSGDSSSGGSASAPATGIEVVMRGGMIVPGDTVTVRAGGFRPGSTVRIVMFSTPMSLGVVESGPDGTIDEDVEIPESAELGDHTIVVDGEDEGGETVERRQPVTLVPNRVPVLESFSVSSGPYQVGDEVRVDFTWRAESAVGLRQIEFRFEDAIGRVYSAVGRGFTGGVGSVSFTLDDQAAAGVAKLAHVELTDMRGNASVFHRNGSVYKNPSGAEGPASHSLNLSDHDLVFDTSGVSFAPVLESVRVTSSGPYSEGDEVRVDFTWRAPSGGSLEFIEFRFEDAIGRVYSAVGRGFTGGVGSVSFALDDQAAAGVAKLVHVELRDGRAGRDPQSANSSVFHRNGSVYKNPSGAEGPTSHSFDFESYDLQFVVG